MAKTRSTSEPTWDIATLYPAQGQWSEEEYLSLQTNHLVEFSHGQMEIISMPTTTHQTLVFYLAQMLMAFVRQHSLGRVWIAPIPVLLWPGKYREPDVVFVNAEHSHYDDERRILGADLVMEVVSENRQHDYVTKRREYEQAGIPEYWIIDPRELQVTVLTLAGTNYVEHGVYKAGDVASSLLLDGFNIAVSTLFDTVN
jgi:Uma2 family endonuclease